MRLNDEAEVFRLASSVVMIKKNSGTALVTSGSEWIVGVSQSYERVI